MRIYTYVSSRRVRSLQWHQSRHNGPRLRERRMRLQDGHVDKTQRHIAAGARLEMDVVVAPAGPAGEAHVCLLDLGTQQLFAERYGGKQAKAGMVRE